MKNRKKGFTIVELVIVIAVIAILAGVLIPTFSGIVNKANLSADQQAVRQMNTALAVASVDEDIDSIEKVHEILEEAGFNASNYNPLTKDTRLVWVKESAQIAIVDETAGDKIIYPEELKAVVVSEQTCQNLVIDPNENDGVPSALAPIIQGDDLNNTYFYENVKADILKSPVQLYKFMPEDTNIEGDVQYLEQREMYGEWITDFYIEAHDDFEAGTYALYGESNTHSFGRVMDPNIDVEDGFGALLGLNQLRLTYELLLGLAEPNSNGVRDGFTCGAINFSEENVGKSITVSLVLINPENVEEFVVCNSIKYTFLPLSA